MKPLTTSAVSAYKTAPSADDDTRTTGGSSAHANGVTNRKKAEKIFCFIAIDQGTRDCNNVPARG